jgi:hypothetical protein
MQIGDVVYAQVSGYSGVYVYVGKLGEKLQLKKMDIPYFTLVVSPDKVKAK